MFRLFRRFTPPKTAQGFLIYALTEILLVVIGILIAVTINNWNTRTKERITERISLSRLTEDLKTDTDRFDFLIDELSTKISRCDSVLELIRTATDVKRRLPIFQMDIEQLYLIEANRTTYEEMLNTGRLYSLHNDSLRTDIIYYFRQVDKWGKYIDKTNEQLREMAIQTGLRDYWLLSEGAGTDLNALMRKFPWLGEPYSPELNHIENFANWSRKSAANQLGTVRFLRRIASELQQDILTEIE